MRVRANLECVEPDELRVWLDETRPHVEGRTVTRENWRSYDSARRFLANPAMRRLQVDTWLTRGDCYRIARHHVRLARIFWGRMWDGIGPVRRTIDDQIKGLEELAEALRYRELAHEKWPDEHSHPIYDERLSNLHSYPVYQPPPPVTPQPRSYVPDPVIGPVVERMWATICAAAALRAADPLVDDPIDVDTEPLVPGDVVRYTTKMVEALNGPYNAGLDRARLPREPRQRRVVECGCDLCQLGRHVALDGGQHCAREGLERVPVSLLINI